MDKDAGAAIEKVMELITIYAFDVIGALVLLIVGWMLAGWAGRTTRKSLEKTSRVDNTLAPFLSQIVRYLILAVVIIAVLGHIPINLLPESFDL